MDLVKAEDLRFDEEEDYIDSGGFADVYKALYGPDDTLVALKVIGCNPREVLRSHNRK